MRRAGQWVPAVAVGLALLGVWPASPSPFHAPKAVVLIAAAGLGLVASAPRWWWPALPLTLLAGLSSWSDRTQGWALLGFCLALVGWPALLREARARQAVTLAAIGAGLIGSLVVGLQAAGVDPFQAFAPDAAGARLRLYGTLGNPDFVASALTPVLFLAVGRGLSPHASPRQALAAVALAAPLVLTRSFATAGALLAGALVLLLHLRRGARPRRPLLALGALVLAVAAGPLVTRSLGRALEGRAYLTRVALPALAEAPLLGGGPGSTAQRWAQWELDWWKARCDDAACVQAHPDSRFAGLQDHVHDDWLEVALELGVLGLLALLVPLGLALRASWRARTWEAAALLGALVAVLARACVDFPLARPADLCLLAALVSMSLALPGEST